MVGPTTLGLVMLAKSKTQRTATRYCRKGLTYQILTSWNILGRIFGLAVLPSEIVGKSERPKMVRRYACFVGDFKGQ